jgi:SAM-dependent methyltransferase
VTIDPARDAIVDRYSALARTALAGETIRDGDGDESEGCFGAAAYAGDADVPEDALQVSLGCGNPVAIADIRPGDIVLDLGSGGGLDVLLSARRAGPEGVAYGLDASPDMLALARANAGRSGVTNAKFLAGRIEDIPLPADHVDVIISNCVINLSAEKPRVLAEAFRVLRPGGRLGVSDVIADEGANEALRAQAEQQVGCVAGTLTARDYRDVLVAAGFGDVRITPTTPAGRSLHSAIIQAVKPVR